MPADRVVTAELARHLAEISRALGRQVGVFLGRDGQVRDVMVGSAHHLDLPDVGRLRGGVGRFRGLRLIHTHLRGEPLSQDDLNDLALLRLDLVAKIDADAEGRPGAIELAHLDPSALAAGTDEEAAGAAAFQRLEAPDVHRLELDFQSVMRALERELARTQDAGSATDRERVLLIGMRPDDEHVAETAELVRAAGVELAATVRQRHGRIHPRTVLGSGKLQEVVLEAMRRGADVAVFDVDLKPAQARAFEDATGLKAIDRTQLILDIFAQRARSGDGKVQVELAQLKYSLPRLTDRDAGLSRLAGGIGGRGPGETRLEVDRRRVRDRIRGLERRVEQLSRQRDVRRRRRREADLPILSIVGYTNAGKSTLLNALTASEVAAADRLFMTLDPSSRRLRFPREGEVVITDTVGFIAELPPDLVAAFRATLEELADADLLLHVIDAADERRDEKLRAVAGILDDIGLAHLDVLVVLNKADRLEPGEAEELARRYQGVAVSALERTGLDDLIAAAEERLGAVRWRRGWTPEPGTEGAPERSGSAL